MHGFGRNCALTAEKETQTIMGDGDLLMVDANQSWDLDEAVTIVRALGGAPFTRVEEPLAVDRPDDASRAASPASRFLPASRNSLDHR